MFIYKTTHKDGKYYIGRCSRKKWSNVYLGSGTWVKSIKDKSLLSREILSTHDSFEQLCLAEEVAIQNHINDPLCMNWNNKSVGFGTGKHNPRQKGCSGVPHTEESKRKISEARKKQNAAGEWKHPMLNKETSQSIRDKIAHSRASSYEITYEDGNKETIHNLKKFCETNKYCYVQFLDQHKLGRKYRGMTYIKLPK